MALGDLLFPNIEMKLVIAHAFNADVESVKDQFSNEFQKEAAKVHVSKQDIQKLGLKEDSTLSIESKVGKVVVHIEEDETLKEGLAVMPRSPWALALVSVPTDGSPPVYHGIPITVTRSDKSVTPLEELLRNP